MKKAKAFYLCDQKRGIDNDYVEPGNLYRLDVFHQRKELIANIVASLRNAPKEIQVKMIAHFRKADKD